MLRQSNRCNKQLVYKLSFCLFGLALLSPIGCEERQLSPIAQSDSTQKQLDPESPISGASNVTSLLENKSSDKNSPASPFQKAGFKSKNVNRDVGSVVDASAEFDIAPVWGDSGVQNLKPTRLFLESSVENDRDSNPPLSEAQLHKNFTLLMLASEPDLRARDLVKYLRKTYTAEQHQAAVDLVLAQDYKFENLQRRRAEILENAYDGSDVEAQLKKVEQDTVYLSQELRSQAYGKILTLAQKEFLREARRLREAKKESATRLR